MENCVELTADELSQVAGGFEKQPEGTGTYPYDREGKCAKCKVVSWWNSREKELKVCPNCGGSWAYVHTGAF